MYFGERFARHVILLSVTVAFIGLSSIVAAKEMQLKDDVFHYFAFGSNLLDERIKVQIKGAEFESTGFLDGYRLEFYDEGRRWRGAVASITEDPNSHVWGCVWRVPNSFAAELDKQESGYHRLNVTVKMSSDNSTVVCRTYQYSNPERQPRPPSPHYKHVIVSGAVEHELPEHYVEMLRKIKDNGYLGPVELDLVALKHLNTNGTQAE